MNGHAGIIAVDGHGGKTSPVLTIQWQVVLILHSMKAAPIETGLAQHKALVAVTG